MFDLGIDQPFDYFLGTSDEGARIVLYPDQFERGIYLVQIWAGENDYINIYPSHKGYL